MASPWWGTVSPSSAGVKGSTLEEHLSAGALAPLPELQPVSPSDTLGLGSRPTLSEAEGLLLWDSAGSGGLRHT